MVYLTAAALLSVLIATHHVDLKLNSKWSTEQNREQRPVLSQSGPRYYYTAESSDYKAARKTCQTLYGKQYGLAVIQNSDDLKAVNRFLEPNMSPGSQLWIGGVFLKGRGAWAWDTWIDPKTDESTPFSDYANNLFVGGPPHPTKESMTYYTMIDKYSGQFESDEPTTTRRFLCEYRSTNNNTNVNNLRNKWSSSGGVRQREDYSGSQYY